MQVDPAYITTSDQIIIELSDGAFSSFYSIELRSDWNVAKPENTIVLP